MNLPTFFRYPRRCLPASGWAAAALFLGLFPSLCLSLFFSGAASAAPRCLSDCTPRIGIVSAFGEEADILIAQTSEKRVWTVNGNRFTAGVLRGNRVVIVLSGVSMINSTMVTQLMLDHFRVERLIMSGIAGGVNPAHHVGDVTVPERWAMPMEVYWNHDMAVPQPCPAAPAAPLGAPATSASSVTSATSAAPDGASQPDGAGAGSVACLGLRLARVDGKSPAPFGVPGEPGGLFIRDNFVMSSANAPKGEFRFDYEVDPSMLAVAREIRPVLERCGPKARKDAAGAPDPKLCVVQQPRLIVGGRGVSGTAFLANSQYRRYLFEQLQAQTFEMETAALAHVAYANGVPFIAFRSLSDLAGAEEFNADVVALFASGLAETNEAAVTLAFLEAWARQHPARGAKH